ncbi:MAG: hypothetical protein HYY31_02750 [Chloroflexi bacterium]|nr:hypothetical protein [Chloroflexota bacterium]
MREPAVIYICRYCFNVAEVAGRCHDLPMVRCQPPPPGDELSKPLVTPDGRILTRAPQWWLQALSRRR